MNTLYNEFVEGSVATESSFEKLSLKLDRLMLAYESVCRKEELDIREAEIRCMEESGDMDLLESYYIEASEGNSEKKEGLLTQIWEAIKEFFRKIKNFLFGDKQMKKLEEAAKNNVEEEVPEETKTLIVKIKEGCKKFLSTIESIPSKVKNKIDEASNLEKILGLSAIVSLAAAITAAIVVKDKNSGQRLVKVKASEAWDAVKNFAQPAIDKIEPAIDTVKEKLKSFGTNNKVINAIKNAITKFGEALKKGVKHLQSLFHIGSGSSNEDEGKLSNLKGDEKAEYEKKKKEIFTKMSPGEEREKALAELDAKYNVSVHESTDSDDYELPDEFIEESVYDESINEISTLLDTI